MTYGQGMLLGPGMKTSTEIFDNPNSTQSLQYNII